MSARYNPENIHSEALPEGRLLRLLTILFPSDAAYAKMGLLKSELMNHPARGLTLALSASSTGLPLPPIDDPVEALWIDRAKGWFAANATMPGDDPFLIAVGTADRLWRQRATRFPMVAVLLAKDSFTSEVAAATKLDPSTVQAFSALFLSPRSLRFGYRRKTVRSLLSHPWRGWGDSVVGGEIAESQLLHIGLYGNLVDVVEAANRQGWTLFQSNNTQITTK